MKTFHILTYGCQMNLYDSNIAEGILLTRGWEKIEDPSQANLVLVNTCSVREHAENRALGRIRTLVGSRQGSQKIGVMGCMAQRKSDELKKLIPGLDFVLGTDSIEIVAEIAAREIDSGVFTKWSQFTGDGLFSADALKGSEKINGFVAISRGCSNFCTYCIVPHVRGPLRSRKPDDILEEIHMLEKRGKKEIILLGQNVNSYEKGEINFAKLLKLILAETNILRLKFTTSHPKDFTEEIIEVIANNKRIAKDIHLPLQSGSNRILKSMNRKYDLQHYNSIIASLKKIDANISITSDILVGFSGESDEDFQETINAIKNNEYSGFFSFRYSVRPGTKGAELKDDISAETKQARLAQVIKLGQESASKYSKNQIGKKLRVLVEDKDQKNIGFMRGKAENGRTVVFPGESTIIGRIVPVLIEDCSTWTLIGKQV